MPAICKYDHLVLNEGLEAVDGGMGLLILQLNLAGIKTLGSCSGHGKNPPHVLCPPGTNEKLKEFGCDIVVTTERGNVKGFFLSNMCGGRIFPANIEKHCHVCNNYKFPKRKDGEIDYTLTVICEEHRKEALHNMVIDYWNNEREG